ncbi:MAG: TolC family outer membrane protein [Magnetococcus sp. MYC-9]
MTLREAAELAVKNYPDVAAAEEYGKSLDQKLRQAWAGYLPRMDFMAGYGVENSENSTTRSANSAAGKQQHDLTLGRNEAGLAVKQPLFDGFDVRSKVAQATAQLQAAQARLRLTADSVALSAVHATIDLVMKHIQLELIKDNVLLHQRILSKVQKKYEGGAGNLADADQAQSRTFLASANHASSQAVYRNAQAKFSEFVGLPPLKEAEMIRPLAPDKPLPNAMEEALQTALQNNPELEAARLAVLSAEAAMENAKAGLWPKLDLEVAATNSNNVSGNEDDAQSLSAMVRMNYNLFEGGANRARIEEQRNLLEQARKNLDKSQRTLEESVQESWNKVIMARDRIRFMKQHYQVSSRVTTSYHEQFKMGKRTLLDVLNSENELFAAKNGLLFEELSYVKGVYELFARMGQLREALDTEPPATPGQGIRIDKSVAERDPGLLEVEPTADSGHDSGQTATPGEGADPNLAAPRLRQSEPHPEAPPAPQERAEQPPRRQAEKSGLPQPPSPPRAPQPPGGMAGLLEHAGTAEAVREIRLVSLVENSSLFFLEESKALTDPLIGRRVTQEELLALRDRLTLLYVGKGYTSSRLIQVELLPKQGIVVIRIPEFRASRFLDLSGQGVPAP